MQKAKQALVEAGIIKSAGRGRISADGHAWLKAKHDEGVRFSDWPKGKVEVSTSKSSDPDEPAKSTVKVIRTESSKGEKVISEIHYTYPEDEFEAFEYVNGKKKSVSMRECCNNCRVSLVGHSCDHPTILEFRKVFIVPKKG